MACKNNEDQYFVCIKIPKIRGHVRTFNDLKYHGFKMYRSYPFLKIKTLF